MQYFQLFDENTKIAHKLEILASPSDDMNEFFDTNIYGAEKMDYLEASYGIHDTSVNALHLKSSPFTDVNARH